MRATCQLFGGGGSGGLDDIHLSARKGVITVRAGKGGKYREAPVHAQLRPDLALWINDERPTWKGADTSTALLLNIAVDVHHVIVSVRRAGSSGLRDRSARFYTVGRAGAGGGRIDRDSCRDRLGMRGLRPLGVG